VGEDVALRGRFRVARVYRDNSLPGLFYADADYEAGDAYHRQPGAQVTIDQKREEKQSGLDVHPFVEGYGFAESDKRTGAGGRAGVRVEF